MKTITVGEECFGLDYHIPSLDSVGEDRYSHIRDSEEKHAKRHLYENAADVFKNIHMAFLDQHEMTDEQDKMMGQRRFRMEYRVRGEVWDA